MLERADRMNGRTQGRDGYFADSLQPFRLVGHRLRNPTFEPRDGLIIQYDLATTVQKLSSDLELNGLVVKICKFDRHPGAPEGQFVPNGE